MLTLLSARTQLWKYASKINPASATTQEKQDVTDKINQVVERFLSGGKWRGTIDQAIFTVYDRTVTLPRELETMLGFYRYNLSELGTACFGAQSIFSQWYRFAKGGPGGGCAWTGAIDRGEGFIGFRDLPSAGKIKIYTTTTGESGSVLIRGYAGGSRVYTGTGAAVVEGETLSLPITISSVTSATTFDAGQSIYYVLKPQTNGPLSVFHVAADNTETLIASYEPGELIPNYRRYEVPQLTNEDANNQIMAKCKRAFVAAVADSDPIIPANIGALKLGLQALAYEDNNDDDKARTKWADAFLQLDQDKQEFDGDSEIFPFQVYAGYGAGDIPNTM